MPLKPPSRMLRAVVAKPAEPTPLSLEDYKDQFNAAAIPYRHRYLPINNCHGADTVRQYLSDDGQWTNDIGDSRGVNLVGPSTFRNDIFPVLAKIMVLRLEPTYYITMSDLADAVMEPEDANNVLDKCNSIASLFIDDFYDGGECRYDKKELRRIEAILRNRINNKRRVFLSMSESHANIPWLSQSIKDMLSDHARTLTV